MIVINIIQHGVVVTTVAFWVRWFGFTYLLTLLLYYSYQLQPQPGYTYGLRCARQ